MPDKDPPARADVVPKVDVPAARQQWKKHVQPKLKDLLDAKPKK